MRRRAETMGILLEILAIIGLCTIMLLAMGLVNEIGRNDVAEKPADKKTSAPDRSQETDNSKNLNAIIAERDENVKYK